MANFIGTPGNDNFVGTARVEDLAVIATRSTQVRFDYTGGRWRLFSPVGTDTLSSIERLQTEESLYRLSYGPAALENPNNTATQLSGTTFSNGGYAIAFTANTAQAQDVFVQFFSADGESLGARSLVNSVTAGAQNRPFVQSLNGDASVVVWTGVDAAGTGVFMQRFDATGTKVGGEVTVHTTVAGAKVGAGVTKLADGSFWVMWNAFGGLDTSGSGVFGQRFTASGVKSGGEVQFNTTAIGDQVPESIAALSGGGFAATFSSGTDLFVQRFSAAGTKIGGEIRVEPDNMTPGAGSRILATPNNGFFVVLKLFNQDNLQAFDGNGNKVGVPLPIETAGAPLSSVVLLADGRVAVAWIEQSGPRRVAFQFIEQDGTALTPVRYAGFAADGPLIIQADALGGAVITVGQASSARVLRLDRDGQLILPTLTGDALHNLLDASTSTESVAIEAGAGNDILRGSQFADRLDGGAGNDSLHGGNGNDLYIVNEGDRIFESETAGFDTVEVTASYTLTANWVEQISLVGNAAANLIGNDLNNLIIGNNADNVLNGGLGHDRMIGHEGNDTYVVERLVGFDPNAEPGDVVVERENGGLDTVISSVSYTLGAHLENLQLVGPSAISATGNGFDNQLIGNGLNNLLDGGVGADEMLGGGGNDEYIVDNPNDKVLEAADQGSDTILSSVTWALNDNVENLRLTGFQNVNATGNDLNNNLQGNVASNILDGAAGADTMDGGDGGDTYYVDNIGDVAVDSGISGRDGVISSVTHVLGFGIEDLTLEGDANINGTGNVGANIIFGNSGNNELVGGGAADTVYGGFGNDVLRGDGLDELFGQAGDDTYVITGTGDTIRELNGQGTDTVIASVAQSYTLGLNFENLILQGVHVNGFGNTQANVIVGTAGNNLIDGGAGADTMAGLGGDDTYLVDNPFDGVNEGVNGGNDLVLTSITYTLSANIERLTLTGSTSISAGGNDLANHLVGNNAANLLSGSAGDDLIVGAGGDDNLLGGSGNDRLNGGFGNDILDGGLGFQDAASYQSFTTGVIVNLGIVGAQDTVGAGVDTLRDIEDLEGSATAADQLSGNQFNNRLYGFGGNDLLSAGAGDDVLNGGEGDDTLAAAIGNDFYEGGNGVDLLTFAGLAANITVSLEITAAQTTGAGLDTIRRIENLDGSATGNDILIGNNLNNIINGLGGGDLLLGGGGNDTLDGGDGSDTVSYDNSLESVNVDLARGRADDDGMNGTDVLRSIENLTGSQFDDLLYGDSQANQIDGSLGADIMIGRLGNDVYFVDDNDVIFEEAGQGRDKVVSSVNISLNNIANVEDLDLSGTIGISGAGSAVDNNITGNSAGNLIEGLGGNDVLRGEGGNDIVRGDAGDDIIAGGNGNDVLVGGAGAEFFLFDIALNASSNVDRINDFSAAEDAFALSRVVFSALAPGGILTDSAFVVGTTALDTDDRIIYDSASGQVSYDADGSGLGAAIAFATLTPGSALSAADFFIVA